MRAPLRFPDRLLLGHPLPHAAVALFDRHWRFVAATDAAVAIMQIPRADLMGRCVWDIYPALLDLASGAAMKETAADRRVREVTAPAVHAERQQVTMTVRPEASDMVSVEFTVQPVAVESQQCG